MDPTFTEKMALLGAALIIGSAAFWAYCKASPDLPESQRARVLMFVLTLPVAIMAVALTSNPLPALISVIQAAWRGGPSG